MHTQEENKDSFILHLHYIIESATTQCTGRKRGGMYLCKLKTHALLTSLNIQLSMQLTHTYTKLIHKCSHVY